MWDRECKTSIVSVRVWEAVIGFESLYWDNWCCEAVGLSEVVIVIVEKESIKRMYVWVREGMEETVLERVCLHNKIID